jgi:hypothetical protein
MIEVVELVVAEDIAVDIFRDHFGKGCWAKVSVDGNNLIASFAGSQYNCGFFKPRSEGESYDHWVVIESFDDWMPVGEVLNA